MDPYPLQMVSYHCLVWPKTQNKWFLAETPNKGQPPNSGHWMMYQLVFYSEVPLYIVLPAQSSTMHVHHTFCHFHSSSMSILTFFTSIQLTFPFLLSAIPILLSFPFCWFMCMWGLLNYLPFPYVLPCRCTCATYRASLGMWLWAVLQMLA